MVTWRTAKLIVIVGCVISTVGFGVRASFGLFLEPMTQALSWPRETFALALAIQNLLWGLCLPFASALADKFGPTRVLALGALIYAGGIVGMANANTAGRFYLTAGFLTGTGVAFTAFSIALAAMAQAVSIERRSLVLGLGTAAGSFGQVLFSPLSQWSIAAHGWHSTLFVLAGCVMTILPLAFLLGGTSKQTDVQEITAAEELSLTAAVRQASSHRGYLLLTTGFFVCGFHVAFISVHFPAYVLDLGLAPQVGAYAIAIIGLFNIAGSLLSGVVGQRWSKKFGLASIYAARAVAITALMLAPKSELSMYLFAGFMGLLWLSTVPLTSGIVAQVFGVRYLATLFGIVFLSHQVGSFIGVWLGGYLYDTTGTYDVVWWTGVALSVLATAIHLPIDERPVKTLPVIITESPARP